MYTDARFRKEGDKARMEYKGLTWTGHTCVRFYYHMHGFRMGTPVRWGH